MIVDRIIVPCVQTNSRGGHSHSTSYPTLVDLVKAGKNGKWACSFHPLTAQLINLRIPGQPLHL